MTALVAMNASPAPAQPAGAAEPMRLSLRESVTAAFAHNKDIQIAAFTPSLRNHDITIQEAAFDPNFTSTAFYLDVTSPSPASLPNSRGIIIPREFTRSELRSVWTDPMRFGSTWSADLTLRRDTSSAINVGGQTFLPAFPETYYASLNLSWIQPILRGFGRGANETRITLAAKDQQIGTEEFRKKVQDVLLEVENAYWTLVFERQDLEVRQEALHLAEELLRLNKIRVEVGTLPPIDITQAEAGVASREEAVIIAEANIENAEDLLRRLMGLDPQSPEWRRPIVPEDDFSLVERDPDLDAEIRKAIDNRTDLASARLQLEKSDASLKLQKDQLRYRLDFRADYTLEGLAGDDNPPTGSFTVTDPNGAPFTIPAGRDENLLDAVGVLDDTDFPTYQATVVLGIPIGNRNLEAQYVKARLEKEQRVIEYDGLAQAAIVEVGTAVRRVRTDRKRIQAAEKNRVLQEKTVEAEQKKFQNGLSTSFEVLQIQRDLAEARSSANAARRDYRNSLASLEAATGVLERARGVRLEDYENKPE
jgi:outer membrane protein TolC